MKLNVEKCLKKYNFCKSKYKTKMNNLKKQIENFPKANKCSKITHQRSLNYKKRSIYTKSK